VIESLHPFAIGVVVACMPLAAIAVSAGIDYVSHRNHEHQASIAPSAGRSAAAQASGQPGNAKALPASARLPATARKSDA
jgi:hypothetical protein